MISAGSAVAETPREASGVSDITGGLPRVTEIFEARKPKDPAVLAEIDGVVELATEKKRGKRAIIVRNESGLEVEHLVPPGKRFRVHAGDHVKAGSQLVDGPLVPHDILRVSGEEAVQEYLCHEVQQVYRSQRVEINDKHVEIIIARMLRKVRIDSAGDTSLLPGLICDRFDFQTVNEQLNDCLKVTDVGESDFHKGQIIPKVVFEETNAKIETLGGKLAKGAKPKKATYSTQLLGITKASVQSSSFISAASFQETTKVLTEAALAGKVDNLVGLKENVILGHLIPAGTGYRTFQDSEVQYNLEAMREVASQSANTLEEHFPLLDSSGPASHSMSNYSVDTITGAEAGMTRKTDALTALVDKNLAAAKGNDDLTLIEGIGPKIAALLAENDIDNYATLAMTHPNQIKKILEANGLGSHDPSTWPDQSQLAAGGEWDQLKEWQDVLQGGRIVGGDGGSAADQPSVKSDDLTKIEGIGPKIAEHLNNAGILTYAQLAATKPEQIREILDAVGGLAAHDPGTWPDQASLAAFGEWDKLREWQDELQGGV
jgi:DNA-directed RNA polymerase subunit beta'